LTFFLRSLGPPRMHSLPSFFLKLVAHEQSQFFHPFLIYPFSTPFSYFLRGSWYMYVLFPFRSPVPMREWILCLNYASFFGRVFSVFKPSLATPFLCITICISPLNSLCVPVHPQSFSYRRRFLISHDFSGPWGRDGLLAVRHVPHLFAPPFPSPALAHSFPTPSF